MHTIIHIGAGRGEELDSYLSSTAEQIVLVEPQPDLAAGLRERVGDNHRVSIIEAAVSPEGAGDQLHRFNLAEASSLYEPTGLKEMFPGLKTEAKLTVDTVSPAQLLATYPIPETKEAKLIIDAPGAEVGILQDLLRHKDGFPFSEIQVVSPGYPYYSSGSNARQLIDLMEDAGYQGQRPEHSRPDWPCWIFQRNPLQTALERAQARADEASDHYRALEKRLAEQKANEEDLARRLADAERRARKADEASDNCRALEKRLAEQKANEESLASRLADAEKRGRRAEQQLKEARSEISSLNQIIEQLKDQAPIAPKLDEIAKQIKGHIDKSLLSTSKQLESYIGLQNYLNTGEQPLNYHGWPISPDLALYLTQIIESKNYDLIIEFGSGTSTALFAKIIWKKIERQQYQVKKLERGKQEINDKSGLPAAVDAEILENTGRELPRRIVSFEHKKAYFEETKRNLKQQGLDRLVNLVYAPLVDYRFKENDFLYYLCDQELEKIAQTLRGREAKILVLVDGPPGATGPLARFPAMPYLLKHFSTHHVSVILDDSNRKEEKEIADRWIQLIEQRGLQHKVTWQNGFEKGALLIEIN